MKKEAFSETVKARIRRSMREAIKQEAQRTDLKDADIIRRALSKYLSNCKRHKAGA